MVAVSLKLFLVRDKESKCSSIHVLAFQGKWGYCKPSCYEDQLLDGSEYCGVHSSCVNNDDDTRGLTCQCEDGFTAHRPNFGEWGMHYQLAYGSGQGPCLSRQTEEFWNNFRHAGCRDLNECTEGGKKCKANTDCVNTFGAHVCVCQIGFEGDPCETFACCNSFR